MSLRKVLYGLGMSLFLSTLVLAQAPGGQGPPPGTPGEAPVPATVTVQVDCDNGGSINDALGTPAVELTIEISGICEEEVLLERDHVTLLGTNPLMDGIDGVSTDPDAPPTFGVALYIHEAINVTVENLKLTGAILHGLRIHETSGAGPAQILVKNCRFEANIESGLTMAHAGARFEDIVITNNGSAIGAIMFSSIFTCEGCDISGDLAGGASSSLTLGNSTLEGSFLLFGKSLLSLLNTDQTANPSGNLITSGSQLIIQGTSTTLGLTSINSFSTGVLGLGTTHTGALMCFTGSDVVCNNPVQVTGASTCASCM